MHIFSFFSSEDLGRIASCSRACFVFAHEEELWKPLCVSEFGTCGGGDVVDETEEEKEKLKLKPSKRFLFQETWRKTYIYLVQRTVVVLKCLASALSVCIAPVVGLIVSS